MLSFGGATAHLVADDTDFQRKAAETEVLPKIIAIVKDLETPNGKYNTWSATSKAKLLEASFMCMASLALAYEAPRAAIADAQLLPFIKSSLSHESYGVRASACQVARALSRSVAILRTNLVDSGIADEIFALLKAEEERDGPDKLDAVAIAATATLCNLITEFSPMQTAMIESGGIELLVRLCDSPSQQTRTNAIWALRNMLFKNEMKVKKKVIQLLTWPQLVRHIRDPATDIQEQGLALLRNIACEGTEEEVGFVVDGMGEELFDILEEKSMPGTDAECLEQAIYVLYNIALGTDSHREYILNRKGIIENLKAALCHQSPLIKIPALGTFINLIEPNDGYKQSRQDVAERLEPYQLESIVKGICLDPTYDVRDKAQKLLDSLETGVSGDR